MIVTPFLMTADLELYLQLVLFRNISNKNLCTKARSESALALNLFFLLANYFL